MVWLAWLIRSLRRAGWAPLAVFVFHVVVMLCFDLYGRLPEFDIPMHFLGGLVIAYFFTGCYRSALELELLGQPSAVLFPVLILSLTSLAAVVWEFAEFVADQQLGLHTQPSLADTMLDLLLGLLGGAVWIISDRRRWLKG